MDPAKFTAFNVLEDEALRQGMFCYFICRQNERKERNRADVLALGIKEYSEWPTIPQLYVDKEFVGGCDILVAMHQNGELAKMLEEKKVLVPAEGEAPKA